MTYLIHEHKFHVIIERSGKQMTACHRSLPKKPEIVPQPPADKSLCRDCFYAVNPGRQQRELTAHTKAHSPLCVEFDRRPPGLKKTRTLKPLAGQLSLPLAEGEGKIFDGQKWVVKD